VEYEVIITRSALRDLEEIRAYIARDNPAAALARWFRRRAETIFPWFPQREGSCSGKKLCSKVRDREDALAPAGAGRAARTRAGKLCAPQSVHRSSCDFQDCDD
jgi:hypothetical protein